MSKTPPSSLKKRPIEELYAEGPRKKPCGVIKVEDQSLNNEKLYMFSILLPNGTILELKMNESRNDMPIEAFVGYVRTEYVNVLKEKSSIELKRRINWNYQNLHFTDAQANEIRLKVNFRHFAPNKRHFLALHDGLAEPETYEDMWDLTPHTDLLKELPDEYTFETALADLIDNSLQALWSNLVGERRLISVELLKNRIIIFDSGPGMDGTDGKIVKWGKMGASLHRSSRTKAIGGKPPYLMPFFGMYGYGGPVATMHLGRRAVLSSKTKSCSKVYTLHLEKEALMNSSRPEKRWRTKGGIRDPSQDEKEKSPHGSFTRVEISDLKMDSLDLNLLQCKLKDIYFPYIQNLSESLSVTVDAEVFEYKQTPLTISKCLCDDMSGKTSTPIEFQVNGIDLAEIEGGEAATANLHSCNGPDFILQLHFSLNQETSSVAGQRQEAVLEANARLKCVYFPVLEGEESIKRIINKLQQDGLGIRESYESFSRVSIRRLGRLLPDARWAWLPFMEPKQRKGERAQVLKRCCFRVKCFVDTDSGFNPTPSKTNLAHHHPYTSALKTFGSTTLESKKDVLIEIRRDGKKMNLSQLEKQYHDWIVEMHDRYDEEIDTGLDEPEIIVLSKDKKLGRFSDVVRVHKEIRRRGMLWKAGQKIKILKGACSGFHKMNVFATLEYILLDGFQGDACGEARLICRQLGVPEDRGCLILDNVIDIRDSSSVPLNAIDSEKCIAIDDVEWKNQLEKYNQKLPSSIDLLSREYCQQLEIEGGLFTNVVEAGGIPPENIVAIIRPKAFDFSSSSKKLDQRFIVKENLEMMLEVNLNSGEKNVGKSEHQYSARMTPSSRKGFQGLYIFPLRSRFPKFQQAGFYTFSLYLKDLTDVHFQQVVQVRRLVEPGSWTVLSDKHSPRYKVRVGSQFPPLKVGCSDRYGNNIPFSSIPKLIIKVMSSDCILAKAHRMKVDLATDNSTITIKDFIVESSKLDMIRPNYEATLNISSLDKAFTVEYQCQVLPGTPHKVNVHPRIPRRQLLPGQIVEVLGLEVFDSFGNHVKEDEPVLLRVDGFSLQDLTNVVRKGVNDFMMKVDGKGCVDLGNILKVSKGYGKDVILTVINEGKIIHKLEFQTERRELWTVTKVFKHCEVGSQLKNVVFEITCAEGVVDKTINDDEKEGKLHTLTIKSDFFDVDDSVRYSFRNGRCSIRAIPLPHREGIFFFTAAHSRYPDLKLDLEVHVEKVGGVIQGNVGNIEDLGNREFTTQVSRGNLFNLPQSPSFEVPEVENGSSHWQNLNGNMSPFDRSTSLKTPKHEHRTDQEENFDGRIFPVHILTSQNSGNLADWSLVSLEELMDDLASWGLKTGERKKRLDILESTRSRIQQHLSDFQASIDRDSLNASATSGKELIITQIESRSESAAAVICKSLREIPFEERPDDILGIVALLGSVQTIELSRMLAQYLGEEQMLAVVCKNYVAAENLEACTLNKFATQFGRSVTGGYNVLCVEDIRPIFRGSDGDLDGPHPFQLPTFPDGSKPLGFRGFAVDMISIEPSLLQWSTESGHGLRETLFYRLFGELQVYENRECMKLARSCIKDGAISLDGGIMRGNGLLSLGHSEPAICFPVRGLSPYCMHILTQMEEKKVELMEIYTQLEEENKLYEMETENFHKSRQRYLDFQSSSQQITL